MLFFPIQGQYIRSKLSFIDYSKTFIARPIGFYFRLFYQDGSLYNGIAVDQPLFRPKQLDSLLQALQK